MRLGLLKNFTALKEQIDRDAHDICKVMDDFCFFSSSQHFLPTKQDPVGEGELSAGSEATDPPPTLSDLLSSLQSLREAISHPILFIQRMRLYYEEDKAVYEKASV